MRILLALVIVCGFAPHVLAANCDTKDAKVWHVLVQTQKGTVSVVRNITKAEAEEVLKRMNPWRGVECKSGCFRMTQDTDAIVLEAFGPAGCEMIGWSAYHLQQEAP